MTSYFASRLLSAIPFLLFVLVLAFILIRTTPGDPVSAYMARLGGESAVSQEFIDNLRRELGLDQPGIVQFVRYVQHVLQGDLGVSFSKNRPALAIVRQQLPFTVQLAFAAIFIAVIIGIPVGIMAARRRGKPADFLSSSVSVFAYSMPNFWFGLILISIFSVRLGWFPVLGVGEPNLASRLQHLVLPALTLGLSQAAYIVRMSRSAMVDVLGEDYIRTARSKGVGEMGVAYKHAIRNALIPVVTVIGLTLGRALGGSAVVEILFGRIGMGSLLVESITQRDYVMTQAGVLVFAAGVFVVNLLVDITYGLLNPRIRYT
ncbi:MAG TPA: ABC transporter permease [Trueperaceae bacterium]|jgi:ABC-type dipeptide/oligopeptide/nickel transport system permease component